MLITFIVSCWFMQYVQTNILDEVVRLFEILSYTIVFHRTLMNMGHRLKCKRLWNVYTDKSFLYIFIIGYLSSSNQK